MKSSIRIAMLAALAAVSVTVRLTAQTTYTSVSASGLTAGAGSLNANGFSVYEYVGSSGGAVSGDPVQGVAASSLLGGSQVGYIGGHTSTDSNLTSTASTSPLEVEVFYGAPANSSTISYVRGSTNNVLTQSVKFSISQSSAEAFDFSMHDAGSATGAGGTGFGEISIAGSGAITYYNNFKQNSNTTGQVLIFGDVYTLSLSANYNTDTWSAILTNNTLGTSSAIVTNGSTDGNGFTLSGYADQSSSMTMAMFGYSATTSTPFNGRLSFDDLTSVGTSAVPEPSTYAAIAAVAALGLAVYRRRRSATTVPA